MFVILINIFLVKIVIRHRLDNVPIFQGNFSHIVLLSLLYWALTLYTYQSTLISYKKNYIMTILLDKDAKWQKITQSCVS